MDRVALEAHPYYIATSQMNKARTCKQAKVIAEKVSLTVETFAELGHLFPYTQLSELIPDGCTVASLIDHSPFWPGVRERIARALYTRWEQRTKQNLAWAAFSEIEDKLDSTLKKIGLSDSAKDVLRQESARRFMSGIVD